MAKNIELNAKVSRDIDQVVQKVLNGLGNPEPPLDLNLVRELQRLDRGYYSSTDTGLLQEAASKIRIGTKQILLRPSIILDAVRKFDLRALYLPDQKRILIDKDQPKLKHRWNEAHEIGHSLIPWHEGAMLGDDDHTLVPSCHAKLENEANFAAARLLFLRQRFIGEAKSLPPSIKSLKILASKFGNTNTSTLFRCVEAWGDEVPILGLVTDHPKIQFRKESFDPSNPCRYFIQSQRFAEAFGKVKETEAFDLIVGYCRGGKGGPLGHSELCVKDDNGDDHIFEFESFSFYHQTLTLGIYKKLKPSVTISTSSILPNFSGQTPQSERLKIPFS